MWHITKTKNKKKQKNKETNWYCNSYHLIAEPQGIYIAMCNGMVYRTKNWVANRTC